jgi:CRP/FNR family cyclic AMP-dependent transcriptional regulator
MQHHRHAATRTQRPPSSAAIKRSVTARLEPSGDEDRYDEFKQGETIFKEGDAATMMYVVVEGAVRISVNGRVVENVGTGGVLGEMALLGTGQRSATAAAATDCKLAPVDLKRFTLLVQQVPHFSLQVMRVIVDRLRRMDQKL